jgi:cystathionine gamma-synthase
MMKTPIRDHQSGVVAMAYKGVKSASGEPHVETLAVHAGSDIDSATGAVTSPIHMSTTFVRSAEGTYTDGFMYGRTDNPNRRALEECLAALEGGERAFAFSSGQAASAAAFMALGAGDHLLLPADIYYLTGVLGSEVLGRWGLETSMVDMSDLDAVRAAIRPNTRMIWVETPSNPRLKIADIAAIVEIAHAAGAWCVCDNTWATPIATRPLLLGADAVMHSTTKYLAGHSDVTGGALILREEGDLCARVKQVQNVGGAVPSPFDCWLLLRSIRTLPWRVRAHSANATAVATSLAAHPAVERVNYPGLPTHEGYDIAQKQMSLPGGMLSIEVRGGAAAALRVTHRVRLFTVATSLGGVESLIEHRRSVEGATSTSPESLLRISVGLEHADDLIADLAEALS